MEKISEGDKNSRMDKMIKTEALKLFREKGYQNVTISDICEACHITKPTFYKYAGKKEDLIVDLYDDIIAEILNDPLRLVECDSYYEQLVMIFASLITQSKNFGPDLFSGMLVSNLMENRHSFDMRDSLTSLCIRIIEKAQNHGEICNLSKASSLYHGISHMFMGYETNWCIHSGLYGYETEFFTAMNDLLMVREDLRALYLKYDSKIHFERSESLKQADEI